MPNDDRGDADSRQPLGAVVRARRRRLGLRQTDVANLAGCSPQWITKLESGTGNVRLDKVEDVLDVLGLHLEVVSGPGGLRAGGDVS